MADEIDALLTAAREGIGDSIAIARTTVNDIALRRQKQKEEDEVVTTRQNERELPIVDRAADILKTAVAALTDLKRSRRRDES